MAQDGLEEVTGVGGKSKGLFELGKTPIKVEKLKQYLKYYDKKEIAVELAQGFEFGFSLHYTGSRLPTECHNLPSVRANAEVVRNKIEKELLAERIAGPFTERPIATLRISPLDLVPKQSPGEFRLIHHLSYPSDSSVNDGIDAQFCSVHYTSFDEAIHMVQDLGKGCLMGKTDIKSAFRLLPLSPADFDQVGFKFEGSYYVDKMLAMGCSISCSLFEKFSTFIEFLVKRRSKVGNLKHYCDDFLHAGRKQTDDCRQVMQTFFNVAQELGVPIASEKTVWPTTVLVFLGLEIDSEKMVVRIPLEKLIEIKQKVSLMLSAKKTTLKEMQSLIGVLNFACRAIVPGRPFIRRLINQTKGLNKPFHHLHITRSMKEDMSMWLTFFDRFNGVSVFHDRFWVSSEDVQLFTDASGMAFGCYFEGRWMFSGWPVDWLANEITKDITILEIFPILVSVVVWGNELKNKKILFRSDNQSVVHILNNMTSKSEKVMFVLRALTLECLNLNIVVKAKHIPGKQNVLTDCLSRFQVEKFKRLAPDAESEPSPIPIRLWTIFNRE